MIWEDIKAVMAAIAATFAIVAVVAAIGAAVMVPAAAMVNSAHCHAAWKDRAEWGFWSGCMVKTNRGLLPESLLNSVDIGTVVEGR